MADDVVSNRVRRHQCKAMHRDYIYHVFLKAFNLTLTPASLSFPVAIGKKLYNHHSNLSSYYYNARWAISQEARTFKGSPVSPRKYRAPSMRILKLRRFICTFLNNILRSETIMCLAMKCSPASGCNYRYYFPYKRPARFGICQSNAIWAYINVNPCSLSFFKAGRRSLIRVTFLLPFSSILSKSRLN